MTTEEIERDDARILAAERARPSSRPPVNNTEEVFPASGWPTGPQVQVCALRSLVDVCSRLTCRKQEDSTDEFLTDEEILARAPSIPPPIPARSPLRPRYHAPTAAIVQPSSSSSSSSRGSSLFGPGGSNGFYHGNPWSLSGRLLPVVALLSTSAPPSDPSDYLAGSSPPASVEEEQGPRGVDYTPEATGLTSGFSSSSSSGASVAVSLGTSTVVFRGRRWSV